MRRRQRAIAATRPARSPRAHAVLGLTGLLLGSAVGLGTAPAGAAAVPHAQYLGLQWGLSAIAAPTAWQYGSGAGVPIGIVDTGVDFAQQDLQGKVVASTAIVSSPSSGCAAPTSAQDDNGHGTHVAGIAAASGAVGVDGAAPGATLVVAKVLDCTGSGSYQDVDAGIRWVVDHGARVVNLSLGDAGTGLIDQSQITGQQLASALEYAWNHGAIGVVAAGNNSNGLLGLGESNYASIPAVVVAATGPGGRLASYSNSIDNAQWGVAAPGGDDPSGPTSPACGTNDANEILSTYWTAANPTSCYATDEGTSMATPFVSGTLALLLGRGLNATQAVQTLLSTANRSVACGSDCSGLVNAGAAVQSTVGRSSPAGGQAPPGGPGSATTGTAARPSGTAAASAPTSTAAPTAAAVGTPSSTRPSTAHKGRASASSRLVHTAGNPWWLILPILAGLVLLAVAAVGGRRLLLLRRLEAESGDHLPGPPDPGEGIPASI